MFQQEEVDEERHRGDRFRSRIGAGRRSPIPHQPLHSRYSFWNGRPYQDRDVSEMGYFHCMYIVFVLTS